MFRFLICFHPAADDTQVGKACPKDPQTAYLPGCAAGRQNAVCPCEPTNSSELFIGWPHGSFGAFHFLAHSVYHFPLAFSFSVFRPKARELVTCVCRALFLSTPICRDHKKVIHLLVIKRRFSNSIVFRLSCCGNLHFDFSSYTFPASVARCLSLSSLRLFA